MRGGVKPVPLGYLDHRYIMDEKQPEKLTPHQIWVMFTAFQAFCLILMVLALVLDKKFESMVLGLLWALSRLVEWYLELRGEET